MKSALGLRSPAMSGSVPNGLSNRAVRYLAGQFGYAGRCLVRAGVDPNRSAFEALGHLVLDQVPHSAHQPISRSAAGERGVQGMERIGHETMELGELPGGGRVAARQDRSVQSRQYLVMKQAVHLTVHY